MNEKHVPQGRRQVQRPRRQMPVGVAENVANLFPLMEADYTWSKRAGIAGAGVLLGLLVAKVAGHKTAIVPPITPAKPTEQFKKVDPSPKQGDPSPTPVPIEKVFQKETLGVQEAKEFINPSEGVRSRVYNDSRGRRTVGVGINLDAPGAAKLLREAGINYTATKDGRHRLTEGEIETLFTMKVQDAMAAGPRVLKTFEDQPRAVQLAVVDMVYNLGPTGFRTLGNAIDALEAKDYSRAANWLERSHWYRQVGNRAENVVSMIRSAGEVAVADNLNHAVASTFGGF